MYLFDIIYATIDNKNIHKLLEKKIPQKIPQVLTKMTLNAINYKMLTQFLDE